jgi:hypothetical protein
MLSIELSQAKFVDNLDTDMTDEAKHQRRTYDINKLRHFLLTSNAEQRAAKRARENLLKRKLVRKSLKTTSIHSFFFNS